MRSRTRKWGEEELGTFLQSERRLATKRRPRREEAREERKSPGPGRHTASRSLMIRNRAPRFQCCAEPEQVEARARMIEQLPARMSNHLGRRLIARLD